MAIKRHRVRGEMSLYNEKEDKSNTEHNTDLDHANDKYLLQL